MSGEWNKVWVSRLQAVFRKLKASRGFTDVGLASLILAVAAVLGAVCLFYVKYQGRTAAGQSIRLFLGSFGVVLLVGLGICMMALYLAGRHHRRVRREVGIPWTTNGHGTRAMYQEMNFQQTVLQLNSKLTRLEDKAHELETVLMQRALKGSE